MAIRYPNVTLLWAKWPAPSKLCSFDKSDALLTQWEAEHTRFYDDLNRASTEFNNNGNPNLMLENSEGTSKLDVTLTQHLLFEFVKTLLACHSSRLETTNGWRLTLPPTVGPHGDVQCDIALDEPIWSEQFSEPLFSATHPRHDAYCDRNPFGDNLMRYRRCVRFHVDVKGRFSMKFGADLDPYIKGFPASLKKAANEQFNNGSSFLEEATSFHYKNKTLAQRIHKVTGGTLSNRKQFTHWQYYLKFPTSDNLAQEDSGDKTPSRVSHASRCLTKIETCLKEV